MSDPGCTVDADGSLKSPDNIVWYNDADDNDPMATVPNAPSHLTASSSASSLSQGNLDSFVHLTSAGKGPANIVAGSWWLGQALKPSTKVHNANLSSIPAKHPATSSMPASQPKHVSLIADNMEDDLLSNLFEGNDDEMLDLQEVSDSEDKDEQVQEEYERNQAMADADCDVSQLFLFLLN